MSSFPNNGSCWVGHGGGSSGKCMLTSGGELGKKHCERTLAISLCE